MIPRGADFPPDSAPLAKDAFPKRCGARGSPCLLSPPRAVGLFHRQKRCAAPGKALPAKLQCCSGRTQGKAPHTLRVMTPGVCVPATARTATIRLRSRHCCPRHQLPAHALHLPDFAAHAPEKRQLFLPKALRRPRQSGKRPRFLQRTFLNFSTQKKNRLGLKSVLSLDTLSCSCFLSLEHFLRAFSPRLRRHGKRVSAFQVLKLFGRYSPQPESSCSGEASGRADARMTRSAQTLFFTDLQ